jgi:hypothetical protein
VLFFPAKSNIIPLWTETFAASDKERKVGRVVEYIHNEDLEKYPGGLPTTKLQTGRRF